MPAIKELREKMIKELSASTNAGTKEEIEVKVDFFLSSVSGESSLHPSGHIWKWFLDKRSKSTLKRKVIPIKETEGWITDKDTGDIVHNSGKFFSIKGIKISSSQRETEGWCQPIIDQPEVGILGFLVKRINGVYHFLVQAKEEPGNIDNVQLTTTLMATRSNFEGVHGGRTPLFLDYFKTPGKRRVLVNKLQSEEGARFYKKNNLNMIVELSEQEEIDIPETFIWMSFYQIKELLQRENVVNACARSVLACLP